MFRHAKPLLRPRYEQWEKPAIDPRLVTEKEIGIMGRGNPADLPNS
jgi:hypothetical protein